MSEVLAQLLYIDSKFHVSFTNLIQHLVTFVKNEDLYTSETELLVADQCVQPTRCGDDDVRVGVFVCQCLDVLLHRRSTVKDSSLDIWKVLAEPGIFVLDLICEFTGVTHDESGALARHWLDLLKRRKDEDCSLSEPRLCLAEDIGSEDGLGNAHLLDCDEAMPMLDLLSRNDIYKMPSPLQCPSISYLHDSPASTFVSAKAKQACRHSKGPCS